FAQFMAQSNHCYYFTDTACPAATERFNAALQSWLDELSSTKAPPEFTKVDAMLRAHLAQSVVDGNITVAAQKAGNAPLFEAAAAFACRQGRRPPDGPDQCRQRGACDDPCGPGGRYFGVQLRTRVTTNLDLGRPARRGGRSELMIRRYSAPSKWISNRQLNALTATQSRSISTRTALGP